MNHMSATEYVNRRNYTELSLSASALRIIAVR